MKNYLILLVSLIGFVSYSQEAKVNVASKTITVSPNEFYPTIGVSFNLESITTIDMIIKDKNDKVVLNEVYTDVKASFHKLDLSDLTNDDYSIFFYSQGKVIFQEKISKRIIKN